MEFRGTKGIWRRSQNTNGDIEISAKGFDNLAVVNFYPKGFRETYINGKLTGSPAPDSTQFRTECLYNARLISKAPELLEILQEAKLQVEYLHSKFGETGSGNYVLSRIGNLIKEATEL